MFEKIPFTPEGFERIKEELQYLISVERPKNLKAIAEARAHGDLSENAEYHAAKERQSFLEGKILELQDIISRAEVIDPRTCRGTGVVFGREVVVYDLEADKELRYQVVGPYESDPSNGRISIQSPLGKALLGRNVGEEVKVVTPSGVKVFEIIEII